MHELGEVNEGNGRTNFCSLLSFLPIEVTDHFPHLQSFSTILITYTLWNNLLVEPEILRTQ